MSTPTNMPAIAVLIPTLDRPEEVVVTLESLSRCDYPNCEVIVIDQSSDDRTFRAVRGFLDDPKVRYVEHHKGGLSSALNRGAELTTAEVLAITGDDCSVDPDWLARIGGAFRTTPDAAILFGSVLPRAHEGEDGFVPGCLLPAPSIVAALHQHHRLSGTTANMAVRRSVWSALGGFDEALGVGARFRAAEDLDLALRALAAGHTVLQEPGSRTTHRSLTPWAEHAATIQRNWFGTGVALAKALRCATLPVLWGLARLSGRWLRASSPVVATYGPKPARIATLRSFAQGFASGLFHPLQPGTQLFR